MQIDERLEPGTVRVNNGMQQPRLIHERERAQAF
jgi:hypothetical protein